MWFRSTTAAASVARRDGQALSATTVVGIDQIAALESDWRRLEASQAEPVFFQSYAWCLYIARTREGGIGKRAPEPRIVVVRDACRIVAIWPLAVTQGSAGALAQDLTEPFGQYSGILVDPSADLSAVAQAAVSVLRSWRIDGLLLRRVRVGSPTALALAGVARPVGPAEQAPVIVLDPDGGHAAWHRSLSSKTRKNLRNLRNRLSRDGTVTHTVAHDAATCAAAITSCFAGRTDWLEASGLSSTAFADPAFEAIVGGLARGERDAPPVLAARLQLEPSDAESGVAQDLSLHWGFEHQGRYYAYMAWKNPAFDACSPGRLHLEAIVPALAQRGNTTIDLLVPALPYKTSMATDAVSVQAMGLAFTARGVLMIRGWHANLRPAIRQAVLAMPDRVRRPLMAAARGLAAKQRRLAVLRPAEVVQ